ncbi:hypothetical protein BDY19DRAFT_993039 [Irpex rosettiformis]|uniref:Uncharacterized protein n=1 Tax=Irpex rosettiformis TaxID=378272 RepID=A0ACB8U4X3_9APHY|nr:hypothetical protein BDY19DRAFT_993039 [Irpex rosettiformis]
MATTRPAYCTLGSFPPVSHMIKNYTFACNTRTPALGTAEKLLTISRSISQCRRRRLRQPRVLASALPLKVDPSHAWQAATPELAPLALPLPRIGITKHDAVEWFWKVYSYQLFRGFFKPQMDALDQKTIAALEPDLAEESIEDLLMGLKLKSGEFKPWGSVAQVLAEPPQSVLPKELELITDDYGLAMCPTHYLAVYASAAPRGKHACPRVVNIYPAQAFILALFCSRIHFPPSFSKPQVAPAGQSVVEEDSASENTVTIENTALRLPVAHIRIPEPDAFPILLNFFHKYNGSEFMTNLVKDWVPRPRSMGLEAYRLHYAEHIAKRHSPYMIWTHLLDIRATWRNIMALGVTNEELWSAIYLMWFVVLKAREMQVLKPAIYEGPIRSEDDDDADWRVAWTGGKYHA